MKQRDWNKPVHTVAEPSGRVATSFVPRGLKLIGLKMYPMKELSLRVRNEIRAMQKSLYGQDDWIYFAKGFSICGDDDTGFSVGIEDTVFDADFFLYRANEPAPTAFNPNEKKKLNNISITAIIGENGTGKSTLLDMIIRLLNNLSATIFGENFIYTSAQHLHYINNVYASLAVFIDDEIKILTVKGEDVSMHTLRQSERNEMDGESNAEMKFVESELPWRIHNIGLPQKVLDGEKGSISKLKDWFYTIVINYSLYAYNYRDYIYEQTDEEKVKELRKQMDDKPDEEDYYWLKGVFHKNDGYQTPIVVNPMRERGYINAEKENHLGRQNLMYLAFVKNEYEDADGIHHREFPFRVINQTHHLVSFYHQWPPSAEYKGFSETYLYSSKPIEKAEMPKYESLERAYPCVLSYWKKKIGVSCGEKIKDILKCNDRSYKQQVWDYVVAKTYKILQNYKVYEDDWKFFTLSFDDNQLEEHLDKLLRDHSHRTRKLRRALTFLKYYDEHYALKPKLVDVDDIYDWMQTHVGEKLFKDGDYKIEEQDMLPPKPCHVTLGLVDNKHLEQYENNKETFTDIIHFSGLSSGERQIAYSIGNLMYHIINIDSTADDTNGTKENLETIHYQRVNVLMDEVELYFHPDLQRRFVKLLVDALNSMRWSILSAVNVTLITHSPFVLSDIPESNVLCLTKNGVGKFYDQTFAANIHDLFNNTFVLPDTIGELAKSRIEAFVDMYDKQMKWWKDDEDNGRERTAYPQSMVQFVANQDHWEYLCQIVGDEYLHDELTDMYNELRDFYGANNEAKS